MAVPEQTPYKEYTANGSTTSFALKFQCESKDHLIVLIDDIEPPIATWSLTGGNVVFATAPAAGKKIKLQRNTPFSRTTDYQSYNNSFRPPAVNKDFDWIWLKLQELGLADWLLSLRIEKEIKDRLAADLYYYTLSTSQTDEKLNELKKYIEALVNNITGKDFLPILDKYIKTWSDRTQESKNKDSIHVLDFKIGKTDQQAIQDAVNYCIANEKSLNWDGATLASTSSIDGFWSVRHTGQGKITRGNDVFFITPILAQENTIYVSNLGSNANDGLSETSPVSSIQQSIDNISNYYKNNAGAFNVSVSAGSYTNFKLTSKVGAKIHIKGSPTSGYPAIPTTFVTNGVSAGLVGCYTINELELTDIKFTGYNGTQSSCGINAISVPIITNNVHVEDCYFGVSGGGAGAKLVLRSGLVSNCGYRNGKASGNSDKNGAGIRGLFHAKLELGLQNSGVRNFEVTGCSYGCRFQEYTTGHVDWCNIHDNGTGLRLYIGSRVNATGTIFKNNVRAYWLSNNSILNPDAATTIFDGNENQPIVGEGCSDSLLSISSGATFGFSEKFIRMMSTPLLVQTVSTVRVVDTITLNSQAVKGLIQNDAYYKKLIVKVYGVITGLNGVKAISLRIGDGQLGLLNANTNSSTEGEFMLEFNAVFLPSNSGILMSSRMTVNQTTIVQNRMRTQSTDNDLVINVNAYVANVADSILINAIEWSMVGI